MIGVNICAGLCNRMFQMAYAYSLAKKHGLRFRFENWQRASHHSMNVYAWLIERFMQLPNYYQEAVEYQYEITEAGDDFTSYIDRYDPRMQVDNVWIHGFFQNEKYFIDYRKELLDLFKEPDFIRACIQEKYGELLSLMEQSYFLHVRLGDYVGHYKHWVHLENYYLQVLDRIGEHPLVVFCNDWGRLLQVYPVLGRCLQGRLHVCIQERDEVVCLYMMSRCKKGGICGNSTFGWWGAWLNEEEGKEVYFPGQWMTKKEFVCDIYPAGAKVVQP